MSNSRLNDLLNLSHVPRWSIVPHLRPQSVAEHSFRVAAIALEIAHQLNPPGLPSSVVITGNILRWAITHDGPEAETGDIPSPIKQYVFKDDAEAKLCPWYVAEAHGIHEQERAVVKIADKIEGVFFLQEWGIGQKSLEAQVSTRKQIAEHVEAARSRWGWSELPAIVETILGT
jgi:5'-deoxynucleotidase YfbR-like HD superfamily hydrolase